jgi:glutamate formiminotransferase/formiminotetrahydrofolate cyclodeaminase
MDAFSLPKSNDDEKAFRITAIQDATRYAIEIPLRVMKRSFESMEIIKAMAETGNPNSVTDAGVGALAARSAVMGAFLNVKINASGMQDKIFVEKILAEGTQIQESAIAMESEILALVNSKIS